MYFEYDIPSLRRVMMWSTPSSRKFHVATRSRESGSAAAAVAIVPRTRETGEKGGKRPTETAKIDSHSKMHFFRSSSRSYPGLCDAAPHAVATVEKINDSILATRFSAGSIRPAEALGR